MIDQRAGRDFVDMAVKPVRYAYDNYSTLWSAEDRENCEKAIQLLETLTKEKVHG